MGHLISDLKTICGLSIIRGAVTGVLLVLLGAGGVAMLDGRYREGWISMGVALLGLALIRKYSRKTVQVEPEICPEEAAELAAPGWDITVRRVERDLALRQVNAVLAGRPFRGGHPRSIVTAEIGDLERYLEERISNLHGQSPKNLNDLVSAAYKNSMAQKDFPDRLAHSLAAIVERSLGGQ